MKFRIEQERLNKAFSLVTRAAASEKETFPLATTIRVATDEENRVRLDGTNLTIGITTWVEATVDEAGTVAMPANLTKKLYGALSPGELTISANPSNSLVEVKATRGKLHVHGLETEEFPPMPMPTSSTKPTLLKAELLREVIREVAIASDEGGARNEVFKSMLIQIESDQITFVAADGYGRLSFRTLPLASENALIRDVLVPVRPLLDLATMLPKDGTVELSVLPKGSQLLFSTQWLILSSILTSGNYPNYRAAVPSECQTRVTLKTSDLSQIVNLTLPFAEAQGEAGRVTILGSKGMEPGKLTMEAEAADVGDNSHTIPVTVEGEDQIDLCFNIAYLARILSVISAPEIQFEIGITQAHVGVIRPVGSSPCTHTFASMTSASTTSEAQ